MKVTGYTDEQRRKSSRLALWLVAVAVALFGWGIYLVASGQYGSQGQAAPSEQQP